MTDMLASTATTEAAGASTPIADYGLLADCNSAALVSRGHWAIRPAGEYTRERRYLPGTLVIETTFTTDSGSVRLLDAMAFAEGQRGHELGHDAPHEVVRSVAVPAAG